MYYDPRYVYHSGVKGMHWYQHLFGKQQSLKSYAKGAQTKGIELKSQADEIDKERNRKKFFIFDAHNAKEKRALRKEEKSLRKQSNRELRRASLAQSAANVLGFSLSAIDKVYGAGESIVRGLAKLIGKTKLGNKILNTPTIKKMSEAYDRLLKEAKSFDRYMKIIDGSQLIDKASLTSKKNNDSNKTSNAKKPKSKSNNKVKVNDKIYDDYKYLMGY